MMLHYLFILYFLLFSFVTNAQEGIYFGKLNYGNSSLDYQIDVDKNESQPLVFFSSIELNAYQIPALNVSFEYDSLGFYIVSDFYTYEYRFKEQGDELTGRLKVYTNETEQLSDSFDTRLKKKENIISGIEKEEIAFRSNGLQLKGTVWKPQKSNNTCLFFVTSSQGSDRSASSAEAFYFASRGFVVFHYDKRGTGKSEGNWKSATIEELASDDINAISFISETFHYPFSQIGIKGSSQGGIKVPYILSRLPELKFGIVVSCPGGTLLESDLNYWRNSNVNQIGKENIDIATKTQKTSYEYLAGISSYNAIVNNQTQFGNHPWFKYIWMPEKDIAKDKKLSFSGLPYFKKVTQPILVIQGLSDNIIPENSYKLIDKALRNAGNKDYKIVNIENASHSMTVVDEKFPYFQKLASDYLSQISKWIDKLN